MQVGINEPRIFSTGLHYTRSNRCTYGINVECLWRTHADDEIADQQEGCRVLSGNARQFSSRKITRIAAVMGSGVQGHGSEIDFKIEI